jgi:hypothetical protein
MVVAAVPAHAFKETPVQGGSGSTPPAAESSDFAGPAQEKTGGGKGLDVRIPGLGKLGVLPKLDFGLDILHGAAPDKVEQRPLTPNSSADENATTVRGTIKHRF